LFGPPRNLTLEADGSSGSAPRRNGSLGSSHSTVGRAERLSRRHAFACGFDVASRRNLAPVGGGRGLARR
jgi:hypothetical protein